MGFSERSHQGQSPRRFPFSASPADRLLFYGLSMQRVGPTYVLGLEYLNDQLMPPPTTPTPPPPPWAYASSFGREEGVRELIEELMW